MADISGAAYALALATATAIGELSNGSASAYAVGRATSTAEGSVKNQELSAFATGRATTTSAGSVKRQFLSARGTGRATSTAAGSGLRRSRSAAAGSAVAVARGSIALRGKSTARAYATIPAANGRIIRDSLGVCDVTREILMMWGIESPCKAPDYARRRALNDLNNALQVVWNQARDRDYWTRATETITLASGISSQVLDDDIQNVIGPARVESTLQPLSPIGTRGELDQFADLFLDSADASGPVAYFIERTNQTGNDPARCTFHVTPAPTESTDFLLDLVREAPRFQDTDIDSCPRIPIPHRYIESLLLPVARYYAMSCHLFVFPERKEQIEAEYAAAMGLMDNANPLPATA